MNSHTEAHTPTTTAALPFWGDRSAWRRSASTMFTCLIGCSIGDFGMVIYLQAFHPGTAMLVQMALAVVAGLITSVLFETVLMRMRDKMSWTRALRMALSMSFISIVAMEVVMNTTDFMITGGTMALSNPMYWLAFLPSALAGFLVPLPLSYYLLKKYNKGHH